MKKFLLTILSFVALVATGYTTESKAATADALAVVTTPAEGDAVEQFTEMLVTFNKAVYDQTKDASLYKADGTKVSTLKKEILDNVGTHAGLFGSSPLFTKVRYYVETAVTEVGGYYVQVPSDAFATDDNSEWSSKIKVNFEVKAAAPVEQIVTFDFAAIYGTEASISNLQDSAPLEIDGFTMTFDKANGSSGIVYNKEGNIRLNGSSTSKNADVAGNTVTIAAPAGKVITSIVFNPGTSYANYTVLSADQGNFTSQGNNVAAYWDGYASTVVISACRNKFNPSQAKTGRYASVVINYALESEAVLKTAQYSLNGDNTDTFKGLDVTFNKDVQVVSALFGGGQTVIKNAAGETMGTCFLTAKDNKINAEFSDKLAAGDYTLVFPANTIKTTDGSIVLPETAIAFTIKAAKLDATVTFTTSPILASTGNATVKFDCTATNVEYLVTYDGTEPTADSYANAGTNKQRNITLSTAKKDSI